MAKKNRIGLQVNGLEELIGRMENANVDVREAIGEALIESKKLVTDALVRDTVEANLPAKGNYSTGDLADSIDKSYKVEWDGYVGEIKVGYDFKKAGMVSIFVLFGTPKHKKSQKLYNDIYGNKIKKELAVIQQETLESIIERSVSGNG